MNQNRLNRLMKIPSLRSLLDLKKMKPGKGHVAFVHWDKDNLYIFVGSLSEPITPHSTGVIPLTMPDKPMAALATYLKDEHGSVNQVVALISRPELDLSTMSLPKGDEKEIALMVSSELEQQYGDASEFPTADFVVSSSHQDATNGTEIIDVLIFSAQTKYLQLLGEQCQEVGLKLIGVGARHLGPLSFLPRKKLTTDSITVAIQFYPGETELSICHGVVPVLLRSIRNSTEDAERVAEQVAVEVERCLTLLPQEIASKPTQIVFFGDSSFSTKVSEALSGLEPRSVESIQSAFDWASNQTRINSNERVDGVFAANIGAAWDYFHKSLPVNLLAPKRPPKPANPWIKRGGLATAAVVGATAVSYVLLGDVNDLQTEVGKLESDFTNVSKLTNKYQEKADRVKSVEDWLSNQVDWLSELNEISQRMPEGQNATVRRLTGTLSSTGSAIDLSVQVNAQEYISVLEDRLKSAKYSVSSRQISQSPDTTDYPWNFETRISFAVDTPSWKSYGPPTSSSSDQPAEPMKASAATAQIESSEVQQ